LRNKEGQGDTTGSRRNTSKLNIFQGKKYAVEARNGTYYIGKENGEKTEN
jgi:hypothetical protein